MALGSMRFQLTGKRVLVKMDELPKQVGLIDVSAARTEPAQYGRLMNIGTGVDEKRRRKIGFDAVVGNRVVVNPYGGKDTKVDGIPYKILQDDAVVGIVEE